MTTITTILSGEAGLAALQQWIAPAAIGPLVQRILHPAAQIRSCRLHRAKFKPGRKLTAYYEVTVARDPAHAGATYPLAVTWTLPGEPQSLATGEGPLGEEIRERGLAGPFTTLVAEMEADVHLQISPFDPIYPQLPRLSDPGYVGTPWAACTGYDGAWRVTPIRYRPRQRHVLRYDPQPTAGAGATRSLFAKLSVDDSSHLQRVTEHLADWLAPSPANAAVLRPVAYLPAETTLLYAAVAGTPLSAQWNGSPRGRRGRLGKQLQRAGAALRRLHEAPASLCTELPALDLATESRAIRRTCEQIQLLLPETWRSLDALLRQSAAAYAQLPQEAATFVHGDFKADHLLGNGEHLTLIDFDSCALGDPAYDVGKFLADLHWHAAGHPAAVERAARAAFLAGYGLPGSDPRLQRARLWQTLIGIKIVAHRVPIFEPAWAARTAALARGLDHPAGH